MNSSLLGRGANHLDAGVAACQALNCGRFRKFGFACPSNFYFCSETVFWASSSTSGPPATHRSEGSLDCRSPQCAKTQLTKFGYAFDSEYSQAGVFCAELWLAKEKTATARVSSPTSLEPESFLLFLIMLRSTPSIIQK